MKELLSPWPPSQALMEQVGEDEWRHLSEQERQRKVAMIKLQERRLRQEGHFEEAAALLGGLRDNENS